MFRWKRHLQDQRTPEFQSRVFSLSCWLPACEPTHLLAGHLQSAIVICWNIFSSSYSSVVQEICPVCVCCFCPGLRQLQGLLSSMTRRLNASELHDTIHVESSMGDTWDKFPALPSPAQPLVSGFYSTLPLRTCDTHKGLCATQAL